MSIVNNGILSWLPDAQKSGRADFLAGLTLWALLVPQSVAYAKLAGAPNVTVGLYCIIIVLPIYAIFASSRFVVPSPTTAVSATFSGFLVSMVSPPEIAFQALVLGTGFAYLAFYVLKLGFLTDFISTPVSLGYLTGLALIVIIKQLPDLLDIEGGGAGIVTQILSIWTHLDQANLTTISLSALFLVILVGTKRIAPQLPGGLIGVLVAILLSWVFDLNGKFDVSMVGALEGGLPKMVLPIVPLEDLAVIVPASIGLVILASGEASIAAQALASKHRQSVDMNQQYFAFGAGNIASAFFGGMLGSGASSASFLNEGAGGRTLMSIIWAAGATLLTTLFLTSLFAYVPQAFLAALVITIVWGMLYFKEIWAIYTVRRGEFFIAVLAAISVLAFGILNGLVISMLINVLYLVFITSRVQITEFGVKSDDPTVLLPMEMEDARPVPKDVLAFGMLEGQVFYASAREVMKQAREEAGRHPDIKKIIISADRMPSLDYTSLDLLRQFQAGLQDEGKKLYITDVKTRRLQEQLASLRFDPKWFAFGESLNVEALS